MTLIHRLKMRSTPIVMLMTLLAATLPILFQNCSSPADESSEVSSVAASAPFAFESAVDHIAYMSCSNMPSGYDTQSYFTFKMGAYGASSGTKLNNAFVHATRNLTLAQKAQALAESPANSGVSASLSIRSTNDYQSILQFGGFFNGDFVGPLSASANATALANNNGKSFINSFSAGKFEENIQFTSTSETNADSIRANFTSNSYTLLFGYGRSGNNEALAPTAGSTTSVYGHNYRMNFALGFGQNSGFSSGPVRVMANLREYDSLNGQQTSAVWDCKPEWQFMIVRPQDLGVSALCENHTVEPVPTAAQKEMYDALRAVLPAASWGVNLNRRCVVQKTSNGLCYGSVTPAINYSGGSCSTTTGNCPHYVSICKKR